MIFNMSLLKTMTIDDFYSKDETQRLQASILNLRFSEHDFGSQVNEFNLTPENSDKVFSDALNLNITCNDDESGIFRIPNNLIHFEDFEQPTEWVFAVAIEHSIFNIFEHKSGIKNAKGGYNFNYRNLFEWDLLVNHQLNPGQGVLFRPWIFHSFDTGLIQLFRLNEKL
jgi:hypothetical protein